MVTFPKKSRQTKRAQERAQKKQIRTEKSSREEFFRQANNLLKKAFTEESLNELASQIGIIERKRELTALAFAGVLLIGCVSDTSEIGIKSLKIMCSMLQKYFNISIHPQALHQKINTSKASSFIEAVSSGIISYKLNKFLKKTIPKSNRLPFRILLQDSTVISLPDAMKRMFKGCGGSASMSAVKCDFIIDQTNNCIIRTKLTHGRVPDVSMSGDIIECIQKNDLIIRDLGYFNLSHFSLIAEKGANFISRLHSSIKIYLNKEDQETIDLIRYLKEHGKDNVDMTLYIGKLKRMPVRVIGVKVPPEVVEIRKKRFKENRKKEPSEHIQEWNGYTLMITNINSDVLSSKAIMKLYKIRWQIELLFKNLKSNLNIDNITGGNKYRMLCALYIKIAISFVVLKLYSVAQDIAGPKREVSLDQFTKWLREEGRLKMAFVGGNLSNILKEIGRDIGLLCKQKRKRQTTWNEIEEILKKELESGFKTHCE